MMTGVKTAAGKIPAFSVTTSQGRIPRWESQVPAPAASLRWLCAHARIGRLNFFGLLVMLFMYLPLCLGFVLLSLGLPHTQVWTTLAWASPFVLIPYSLLCLARLQDTGLARSWLPLILLVPVLFLFWSGSRGGNRYGPAPWQLPLIVKLAPFALPLLLVVLHILFRLLQRF